MSEAGREGSIEALIFVVVLAGISMLIWGTACEICHKSSILVNFCVREFQADPLGKRRLSRV